MTSAPQKQVSPWEDLILRLIAIYKILHGLFFVAVGIGLIKLKGKDVPQILMDNVFNPLHFSPENKWVDWALDEAKKLNAPHILVLLSDAAFLYAALFLVEGVGLFLRKHWAEYLVVIVTGSLLPVEIYAICHKVEWWKIIALIGNLLIVGYLVHRLYLDAQDRGGGRNTHA